MPTVFADLETYNDAPISVGAYRYAETAEVLLSAWAVGDDIVRVEEGLHPDFVRDVMAADAVVFHNSNFDRTVLRLQGVDISVDKVVDTMVIALQHSLPGALGALCDVLGIPQDKAKDKDGKKLIQLFSKPTPKNWKIRRASRDTHPEEWLRFIEYARLDVDAMRAVYGCLPRWNDSDSERALWQLDQRASDRGVACDIDLATAALRAFQRTSRSLASAASVLTNGNVTSFTRRDKLLEHLGAKHGFTPGDLTKGTVSAALRQADLDPAVRELLELRQQAAATSPAKYKAFLKAVSADGRLRGMIQFCGASRTGRDSGRVVQLQNLPRPTLKQHQIEAGVAAMKADCEDILYDNVSELCASAIRGCLIASTGMKLLVADLSNIEGRVAAWLAGEDWKVQAFKDFDAGSGPDLYKLAYAKSFSKKPEDVTKDERQIGKVQELALGYQGGTGAFAKMAAIYGLSMTDEQAQPLVSAWRKAHPRVTRFWYSLEQAARDAIRAPDEVFVVRALEFSMQDGWLRMRLPSGRHISYADAAINDGKICYSGTNQFTRKWQTLETYGGKLFENAVQAVARDIFMGGFKRAEHGGYPVVLRVHDELVCEVPDTPDYTVEALVGFMTRGESWSTGLPLSAAGHSMLRYCKMD